MMKPEAGFKPYLIIRRGQAEDAQLLAELGARTSRRRLLRRTRLKIWLHILRRRLVLATGGGVS